MKKLISFITSAVLILTMTACGKTPAETPAEDTRPLGEMRDISAVELIAEMGAGWNLGNTLDAEGGETAWGNPVTEIIGIGSPQETHKIELKMAEGDEAKNFTLLDLAYVDPTK